MDLESKIKALKRQFPDATEWEINEIYNLTEGGDDVRTPRVLLIDIETSPNLGYVWGKWQQDVMDFETEWHILCFAYKWLDQVRVKTVALPDFKGYKKNPDNDFNVVKAISDLFDKADVVIAHNGDRFDLPRINTRLVFHGISPPAPFKTIDTCKIARAKFGFNSNKLDDIGRLLKVGRKMVHTGFALWKGCLMGDVKSWKTMRKYNAQDVLLLENVYLKLRPFMTSHPNFNVFTGEPTSCPKCQHNKLYRRGFSVTNTGRRQRYQCTKCGAWSHGKLIKTQIEIR